MAMSVIRREVPRRQVRGWEPFRELEELHERALQVLDSALQEDGGMPWLPAGQRERKGILRRRTRPVGRFELRARVPGPLDADAVEAKTAEGVLTVRIPKPQQAKARHIEVQSGAGANDS